MATIAEVLHYAADHCLWDGHYTPSNPARPSCTAIYRACQSLKVSKNCRRTIFAGLENMGLNQKTLEFQEFPSGICRQGARYAWLKFAALIAEEQGV